MPHAMTLIHSSEFLHWFDQSKIVGESGLPQIFYHGTGDSITVLEPMRGAIFLTPDPAFAADFADTSACSLNDSGGYDELVYGKMESAGANIIPVFVSCQNPFDPRNPEHVDLLVEVVVNPAQVSYQEYFRDQIARGLYNALEDHYHALQSLGFDGFYEKENPDQPYWNVGVFHSNQVKSVFNRGAFNPASKSLIE